MFNKNYKEQEMGSDLRSQQVENWKTAEETECDKVLHRLLALGKKDDEIVSIFCDDLDNRPKFNKMIYVNAELCDKIMFAYDNCLDAEQTDHREARETNNLPGRYENFNDSLPF
jgi:predicted amidophosphoribosyltransferase